MILIVAFTVEVNRYRTKRKARKLALGIVAS